MKSLIATKPIARKRALLNASCKALEALSRHGPLADRVAANAADFATPRRHSPPMRRRIVLHCTQMRQRSRRRTQASSVASSRHRLKPKYPAQPRRNGFNSPTIRSRLTPRERRVSSLTRLLNRVMAFSATQRRSSAPSWKVKPRKERCHGRPTALFSAFTRFIDRRLKLFVGYRLPRRSALPTTLPRHHVRTGLP